MRLSVARMFTCLARLSFKFRDTIVGMNIRRTNGTNGLTKTTPFPHKTHDQTSSRYSCTTSTSSNFTGSGGNCLLSAIAIERPSGFSLRSFANPAIHDRLIHPLLGIASFHLLAGLAPISRARTGSLVALECPFRDCSKTWLAYVDRAVDSLVD